jgi:hypothetical protein
VIGALRKQPGRADYASASFLRAGRIEHKFMCAIKLCEYAAERVMHGYSRYSRVRRLLAGRGCERSKWVEHHPGGECNRPMPEGVSRGRKWRLVRFDVVSRFGMRRRQFFGVRRFRRHRCITGGQSGRINSNRVFAATFVPMSSTLPSQAAVRVVWQNAQGGVLIFNVARALMLETRSISFSNFRGCCLPRIAGW